MESFVVDFIGEGTRGWLSWRGWAGLMLFLLMIGAALVMGRLGKGMKACGGPGIVAYKFAGSTEKADAIFERWGREGKESAKRSLVADFAFLGAYGGTLVVVCASIADGFSRRGWEIWTTIGVVATLLSLFAAVLDALENWTLLAYLDGKEAGPPIRAAQVCAVINFAIIGLVLVWICVGAVVLGARTS